MSGGFEPVLKYTGQLFIGFGKLTGNFGSQKKDCGTIFFLMASSVFVTAVVPSRDKQIEYVRAEN